MIEIIECDYTEPVHEQYILDLLNLYSSDITGGGTGISEYVMENLIDELKKRDNLHAILAFSDGNPVGLVICIDSFSTFACKPVLNIHDVIVRPECRQKGIAKKMLKKAEEIAQKSGCCKLTLEVLEGNAIARKLYRKIGFNAYELDPKMGKALFLEKKL